MRLRLGSLTVLIVLACGGEGSPLETSARTTPPDPSTTAPAVTSTDAETTTTTSVASTTTTSEPTPPAAEDLVIEAYPLPPGSAPHDVAPAREGGVWYTGQGSGELGLLDPATGEVTLVDLGTGSRPHGVIVDEVGVAWVTDSGLNALVSVDPVDLAVDVYPVERIDVNLNTATIDGEGVVWFTGQAGVYGRLDPGTGEMEVFDAPRGRGPYGIATTPEGDVYYASLAGSFLGRVEGDGSTTVLEPPTPAQGARRVRSDSKGALWISEWEAGNVSRYQPETGAWMTWALPGAGPRPYAIYVDEHDMVWMSDFASNALIRFDPTDEEFASFDLPHRPGNVRQLLGRPGEVWGAESAADHLVVVRTP